jgi:hypothetical protein
VLLKKLFLISTLALLFPVSAKSQDLYVILTYGVSIPIADTKEFIEKPSFIGFGLDIRKLVSQDISIGFYTGWNAFEENTDRPISSNNAIIDTTQDRLINAFPIYFNTHYYLSEDEDFIPFVGLGIGMIFFFHQVEFGSERIESNKWHFGFAPEAGFVYLLGSVYAFANVKYNFAFSAMNEITGISTPQSYFGVNVGFAFTPMSSF